MAAVIELKRARRAPRDRVAAVAAFLSLAGGVCGCAGGSAEAALPPQLGPAAAAAAAGVHIQRFGFTSVYLVRGERWLAIDTPGRPHCRAYMDWVEHTTGAPDQLAALVLTHGHADHAGCARDLQWSWRIPVIAGAGEVPMLAAGRNGPLQPATAAGQLLAPLFQDDSFDALVPDVIVHDTLELRPFGVAGDARQVGGHTPGSLVVALTSGAVFVGDLLMGGSFGGSVQPQHPARHYFTADAAANRRALADVLAGQPALIYPGHGGPLAAPDARALLGTMPVP